MRENYNSVHGFIAALKKILVKAPSLQVLYQEVTGLHFPQFSVIIRSGTWIRCAVFLCENFVKIKCLWLNRCSSHQVGPTISQQQRPRVRYMVRIVMYCIVLKGWSLLPNALRPPNLGVVTWICQLNFAQRPIFSGLRFFNEPEISDSDPQFKY